VGYRHSRDELLAAAVELAAEEGLSCLTYGRLAKRVGISDRTVVYYFPTKDDLVRQVLLSFGARLQHLLDAAFGTDPLPPDELAARAWPLLTTPEADGTFAVFFELLGLASAGRSPYEELAPLLVESWIDWLEPHLAVEAAERRDRALALVAVLDGLLLLRQISGSDASAAAARRLGIPA
jgi:AcrR family transcriptional regulator